jgi:hypothetical protein
MKHGANASLTNSKRKFFRPHDVGHAAVQIDALYGPESRFKCRFHKSLKQELRLGKQPDVVRSNLVWFERYPCLPVPKLLAVFALDAAPEYE